MTLRAEAAGLAGKTILEFWEFDGTAIGMPNVFRWHDGTTLGGAAVRWRSLDWVPFPVTASGFEMASTGALPRPTLKVSNVLMAPAPVGVNLDAVLRQFQDGLGAKITRRRTLAKFMNDPTAEFPAEVWTLARKSQVTPFHVEVELAAPFDVESIYLPRRQVLATVCPWRYRGTECGYSGPPVEDALGNPTTNLAEDECGKSLRACKARFHRNLAPGQPIPNLPYGAFPSSVIVRRD